MYYVVHSYIDNNGQRLKKWLACESKDDANNLLPLVQAAEDNHCQFDDVAYKYGAMADKPTSLKIRDMVEAYLAEKAPDWEPSTCKSNRSLCDNYVLPYIGDAQVCNANASFFRGYYESLLHTAAVRPDGRKGPDRTVSQRTVYDINKILRPALDRMVEQEVIVANPLKTIKTRDPKSEKRQQWTAEELQVALGKCDDLFLKTFIATGVSGTLRTGEECALTWDCVDLSPQAIKADMATITINKTLERVYLQYSKDKGGVYFQFPSQHPDAKTAVVLKTPKTPNQLLYRVHTGVCC